MSEPADDEPVPRLPRGRGLKLDSAMLVRIGMTLALLIMIVLTARPCADATSKFVTDFGDEGSAVGPDPEHGRPGHAGDADEVLQRDVGVVQQQALGLHAFDRGLEHP